MLLLFLVNKKAYQELKMLKQDKCWRLFKCRRKGKEWNITMELTVEQAIELEVQSAGSEVDVNEVEMKGNEEEKGKEEVNGSEEEKGKGVRLTDEDGGKWKLDC